MTAQIIDDQDLSHVKYVGNWVRGGTPGKEYEGTVASSTRVNDSYTVTFKGTSISVYGTLDSTSGGVVSSYALDGAPAAEATSRAGPGDTYNQLFWASPTLVSAGDHQLVVKMVKVNSNDDSGEGTIWFDYFNITGAPSPQKKHNVGAIVGGVVGGVSILILLVLLLLFYRRRRPSKDIPVNPFPSHSDHVLPDTKHHAMPSTDQSHITPITPNSKRGPSGLMVTPVSPPPTMQEAAGSSSSYVTPSSPSSPAEPLQHNDSGLRNVDPVSIPPSHRVELPPIYSPV